MHVSLGHAPFVSNVLEVQAMKNFDILVTFLLTFLGLLLTMQHLRKNQRPVPRC